MSHSQSHLGCGVVKSYQLILTQPLGTVSSETCPKTNTGSHDKLAKIHTYVRTHTSMHTNTRAGIQAQAYTYDHINFTSLAVREGVESSLGNTALPSTRKPKLVKETLPAPNYSSKIRYNAISPLCRVWHIVGYREGVCPLRQSRPLYSSDALEYI